ncbi:hypothetical protein T10_7536 [Trichinella papuae]|uniref:DUF7047 domain-containing protein n=1 Tax=Trichinella papuae TaxID=268474 RepID=A0A0V1N9L1_9BILA|nr:hypothetical protein T10_7536 [Trichinella papuae]
MRATIKSPPPFLSHSQIVTVLQWSWAEGLGEQGKLMWSHFPVCGWLGIAAAYIKRKANDATMSWDKRKKPKDASPLAVSVALEISGSIVKDEAWLRPDDAQHINMAEVDAIIKGLKLELDVDLLRSACNKADEMTRVPRRWLKPPAAGPALVCAVTADLGVERIIADVHHAMGHPGIKQTLYFARQTDPTVSKHQVRQVLRSCEPCKSLDWRLKGGNEEAWRLRSAYVTEQLNAVFYERGPRKSSKRTMILLSRAGPVRNSSPRHRCEKKLHGIRGSVLVQRNAARRPQRVDSPEERKVKSERYAVSDSVWVRPPRARSAASDISEQIAEEEEEIIIHLHPQGAAYAGLCAEPAPEPASVRPRRSMRIHRPTARLCCD